MAKFCSQCGRPLKEGEVCDCKKAGAASGAEQRQPDEGKTPLDSLSGIRDFRMSREISNDHRRAISKTARLIRIRNRIITVSGTTHTEEKSSPQRELFLF